MKKNFLFALTVALATFVSCSNSVPTLDGAWKFEDGSIIKFNTKKQTYIATGTNVSTSGSFQSINGGTLLFDGEETMVVLGEQGFEINYGGDYILFEGKPVDSIENLQGKYKSENGMVFDFNNKISKLKITVNKNEKSYDYKTSPYTAILFTSGDYAYGQSVELKLLDKTHLKLDGEILTR